eukprot:TRINITY_DN6766_c0_g1_i1.p2 TRINITY_DN6766_c0_g1~~TRINITY_DN6766_c0_g1_i1.p2  ORF type:complete len:102 (-),score=28.81 TRINITY_DN6766_c0_g1_i1:111-416(-)
MIEMKEREIARLNAEVRDLDKQLNEAFDRCDAVAERAEQTEIALEEALVKIEEFKVKGSGGDLRVLKRVPSVVVTTEDGLLTHPTSPHFPHEDEEASIEGP